MSNLTKRQQQVYDFLVACLADKGYPPTLQEIASHLHVSGNLGVLRHLKALEREGLVTRSPGSSRAITLTNRVERGSVLLPLVGSVRAGVPELAMEEVEAHILAGDLAVIRPQSTAENGEIVVVLIDGEATLKRFFHEGDRIRLQPENAGMAPIIITAGTLDVVIVGKVTGLCRVLD